MLIPWRSGSVAGYGQAMTDVQIRPVTGDDAEAVSALRRAVYSYKILSPAAARHMITVSSPAERSLALPFFSSMTESQVERVCTALAEALGKRP